MSEESLQMAAKLSGNTIFGALSRWAEQDPAKPAILAPGRTALTFSELIQKIMQVEALLQTYGIGYPNRVALLAVPGSDTAVAALALSSSVVCAPLNSSMPQDALSEWFAGVNAKALAVPMGIDSYTIEVARALGLPILEIDASRSHARIPNSRATNIALLMHTSGTSGRAKCVAISHRQFLARAETTKKLLGLTQADRCLNPMPLCYLHGLGTGVLATLLTGGSVICPATFDEDTFRFCVEQLHPTWLTAGASHAMGILPWLRKRATSHCLRFVRASSTPLPFAAQQELERLLQAPVIESYGASEVGVITANPPNGKRKPGTVGVGIAGEVGVIDESGNILFRNARGEVVVRGAGVVDGYAQDPGKSSERFRDGWFRSGDLGEIDGEGYLMLYGRMDEVINRGGEKVAIHEVNQALLEHPNVLRALTFPAPHPTLHEEVAAAVEIVDGATISEEQLQKHLRTRLAPYKVPRRILVGRAFPLGPTGKPDWRGAAEHFGLLGPTDSNSNPAPMEQILLQLWRDVLNRTEIASDDDFFLCGGDSLTALRLLQRIEEELKTRLLLTELMQYGTPRRMSQRLYDEAPMIADLIGIHTDGTQTPIFAVCGRFGYGLRLLLVGRQLDADQPFYVLQPPGMDWEQAGCFTLGQMAAHYIQQLLELWPNRNYRLLGTSFGGLIVYEMALQLKQQGFEVELLAVVDTEPPDCKLASGLDQHNPVKLTAPVGTLSASENAGHRVAGQHVSAKNAYVMERLFDGTLHYFRCDVGSYPDRRDRRELWNHFARETRVIRLPGSHGKFHLEPQFSALCKQLKRLLACAGRKR